MKFRHALSRKTKADHDRWATENTEDSMTQQGDANDTDINVIMARYQQTGQMPQLLMQPLFMDLSDAPDYRQAVETIRDAEAAFLEIPAKIRQQFGNDAGQFMEFAMKEENREELQKMGLLKPLPQPTMEEQTLQAIRELKPQKDDDNGTRPK